MKRLFISLLVAIIAIPSFSQIKFGIKAGATSATTPTYDISSGDNNIEALKDATWGFHAGLFMRATLLGIYIQPEVLFASNTYDYNVTESGITDVKSQKFSNLEIPVMVGLKIGPIRINAGPAARIPIGSPKALIDDPDFENLYKGATFGYEAGLGIDLFKKLTLDARYGGSLSKKLGDSVSIGGQDLQLDSRQNTFRLSLGLIF